MESILAKSDRIKLENGMSLRLLSALEVMQARREAQGLAEGEREQALCSNACLLARALEDEEKKPIFKHGQEVLVGLTVEEISNLALRWSQFNQSCNPGLGLTEQELEMVKKNSMTTRKSGCAGGC